MQTIQVEFAKLRIAYIIVKTFLDNHGHTKVTSLNNKVEADLGLYGDDNYELLEKFVATFELDHQDFEYSKHFYSEGELFGSSAVLLNLLYLPIWLPLKTIELLTMNKIKLNFPNFSIPERQVNDLTFKALITWYIEKKFKTSDTIRYEVLK